MLSLDVGNAHAILDVSGNADRLLRFILFLGMEFFRSMFVGSSDCSISLRIIGSLWYLSVWLRSLCRGLWLDWCGARVVDVVEVLTGCSRCVPCPAGWTPVWRALVSYWIPSTTSAHISLSDEIATYISIVDLALS